MYIIKLYVKLCALVLHNLHVFFSHYSPKPGKKLSFKLERVLAMEKSELSIKKNLYILQKRCRN